MNDVPIFFWAPRRGQKLRKSWSCIIYEMVGPNGQEKLLTSLMDSPSSAFISRIKTARRWMIISTFYANSTFEASTNCVDKILSFFFWPPSYPLLTLLKEFLYSKMENLHIVDISTYLPRLVNVVCEWPLCICRRNLQRIIVVSMVISQ